MSNSFSDGDVDLIGYKKPPSLRTRIIAWSIIVSVSLFVLTLGGLFVYHFPWHAGAVFIGFTAVMLMYAIAWCIYKVGSAIFWALDNLR